MTNRNQFKFNYINNFQDPVTSVMEGIIDLHNYVFFYLIVIFGVISFVFVDILVQSIELFNFVDSAYSHPSLRRIFYDFSKIKHATNLEIVWTVVPSIILVFITIPSITLLYAIDEHPARVNFTVKVIGSQWYWTYEYSDKIMRDFAIVLNFLELVKKKYVDNSEFYEDALIFVSYMDLELYDYIKFRETQFSRNEALIDSSDVFGFRTISFDSLLKLDNFKEFNSVHRLLSVHECFVLPTNFNIRVLVTSSDVLHSWAVPSCGIKIDAVPGRLNQVFLRFNYEGVFYGQCSELCGVNHAFMPIVVKAINPIDFFKWVSIKVPKN